MASIPANRDVLRQAVIAWGHAQTGGNAIVACNQLPPAVPDDCIRDAVLYTRTDRSSLFALI